MKKIVLIVVVLAIALSLANAKSVGISKLDIAEKSASLIETESQASYKPKHHESACVVAAAGLANLNIDGIKAGAAEPDAFGWGTGQMVTQAIAQKLNSIKAFFGGNKTEKRSLMWRRVGAQHIHCSALPLQSGLAATAKVDSPVPIVAAFQRFDARFANNAPGYSAIVTNKQVRNKLLRTALSWGCQSIATNNEKESGRRAGFIGHMVGDLYSASHVQRSNAGETAAGQCPDCCSANKIQAQYSMDVVDWSVHAGADEDTANWRFKCYETKLAAVYKTISEGRKIYQPAAATAKQNLANDFAAKFTTAFCDLYKFEDGILDGPAGGASSKYSSLQSTQKPIFPSSLSTDAEFQKYVTEANTELTKESGAGGYWYPTRASADYCSAPAKMTCNANVDLFLNAQGQYNEDQSKKAIAGGLDYQPAKSAQDWPAANDYAFKP